MSENMSIEEYRKLHSSGNKKVKNATKVNPGEVISYGGEMLMNRSEITFPSKIECYMFNLLSTSLIDFAFQYKVTLQARNKDRAVPGIAMYIDFVVSKRDYTMYIDTKGHQTAVSKLKYKLLRGKLAGTEYELHFPSNAKECKEIIKQILYFKN